MLQDVSVSYTQAGPIFFIVYYLVNFVLTLITGVIVFLRRERPVVKNLSLPFLMLITVKKIVLETFIQLLTSTLETCSLVCCFAGCPFSALLAHSTDTIAALGNGFSGLDLALS